MIREAIAKLAAGRDLSVEDAYESMKSIMTGEASPAQIGAFITALRIRGETPEAVAGCVRAMRERFTAVDAPDGIVVDTCGTGGDEAQTFNISTAAALVTAGAGVTVAKHGNKSVSSRSGSADVLQALGIDIGVDEKVMSRCLHEVGIAFLFAPSLHPAMKHAIGPRREIGIRTIFNILGPLCNPAGAEYGVLGVYAESLVHLVAEAAADLGAKHLFVVHGRDGLDEITTTGPSVIGEVKEGSFRVYEFNPEEIGLPIAQAEDLRGGSPEENAALILAILEGETGPRRDIVLLNAGAAITAGGATATLAEGVQRAGQSVDQGRALQKLADLRRYTAGE